LTHNMSRQLCTVAWKLRMELSSHDRAFDDYINQYCDHYINCSFVKLIRQNNSSYHLSNTLAEPMPALPQKQTKTQCYALTKTCLMTGALATITQALGHQQTALYWPNRLLTLSRGLPALLIFSAGLGRLSATSPAFFAALPKSGASTSLALLIPAVAPGACCPAVLGFGSMLLSRGEVICSPNKT